MEIPLLSTPNDNPPSKFTLEVPKSSVKISSTAEDLKSFPSTKAETVYSSFGNKAKSIFRQNFASGLTVGLVNLPLSISLSVAAGATPQAGVVTAVVSGLVGGIMGGSHYNVVGPTGALAGFLLKANIYYGAKYGVNSLPIFALFAGILMILAIVAKIQRIIDFVPDSVNEGFTLGVSLILILGQLNNLFGLSLPRTENLLEGVYTTFENIEKVNFSPLVIGFSFVVLLLLLVRKWPKIPWICIFTVIGICAGAFWKSVFPDWSLPLLTDKFPNLSFENYISNLDFGFSIVTDPRFLQDLVPITFVAVLETLISAKIADVTTNTKFEPTAEVVSLGISNILGGLVGAIPSTAALARTKLNILSGGNHRTSGLINAICMSLVTIFLFTYFKYLPLCVIASSVVYVAIRMVDYHELMILFKAERDQFFIAMLVALFSLLLDSTFGVLIGMFIFLIIFFGKFLNPQSDILLPRDAEPNVFQEIPKGKAMPPSNRSPNRRQSRHFSVSMTKENGKLRLSNLISQEAIVPMEDSEDVNKDGNFKEDERFCLYKFMGVVNFLNIESHLKNINEISQYKNIILSFRYCISFDTVALHTLEKSFNDMIKRGRTIYFAFVSPQLLEKINIVCGEEWVEQLKNHKKLFVVSD
jgi:MFS superfamily sulfate permease-like transporter